MVSSIIGLDALIAKNNKRMSAVDIAGIVNRGASLVQAQAKALAPKDTGALIQSISIDPASGNTDVTARVYTDKEYAVHQEYGTVNMAANPYMHPAVKITEAKIQAYAKKEIKKAMA